MMKRWIILSALLLAGGGTAWYFLSSDSDIQQNQDRTRSSPSRSVKPSRRLPENPPDLPTPRVVNETPSELRINSYINKLHDKVNLSAEQREAIRLLIQQNGSADAFVVPVRDGAVPQEASGDTPDVKIGNLLEPGQKENYEVFRGEIRAKRIRTYLGFELAKLGKINLTPEQLEEATIQLSGVISKQEENPPPPPSTIERSKQRLTERMEALKAILSPEQLQQYQKQSTASPKAQ